MRDLHAMHQAFNCKYHQHLPYYRTGSLPQIQRSVGRGTPSSPTYVKYGVFPLVTGISMDYE